MRTETVGFSAQPATHEAIVKGFDRPVSRGGQKPTDGIDHFVGMSGDLAA